MKLKSLIATALLAIGGAAFAQTPPTITKSFDIGILPIKTTGGGTFTGNSDPAQGSFAERWNFTFPTLGAAASASSVSLNLNSLTSITGLSLQLWTVTGGTRTGALGSLVSTGATAGQSVTLNNVTLNAGGNYAYVVAGTDTGALGGSYVLTASAAPVPEPETYALFLAGLAAVGFVARRRAPAMGMAPAAA